MRRTLTALTIAVATLLPAAPAFADHGDGCESRRSSSCDNRNGGNITFDPEFDRSPVVICVQPGSCSDAGQDDGQRTQSLVPPTPEKLVEVIPAIINQAITFATTLATSSVELIAQPTIDLVTGIVQLAL